MLIDIETRFLDIFQLNELNRQDIVISPLQVQEVIKALSRGKAAGPDCLFPEHFLYAPIIELSQCLARLFTAMISLCYVPPSLCNSFVFPIPKGKGLDYSNPNNYRGISVSSILVKFLRPSYLPLFQIILNHISMGYRVVSERDMVLPTLPFYSRKLSFTPGRLVINVMLLF